MSDKVRADGCIESVSGTGIPPVDFRQRLVAEQRFTHNPSLRLVSALARQPRAADKMQIELAVTGEQVRSLNESTVSF